MERGIITINEMGAVTIPTASVWMTKFEIADLFGVFAYDIRKAIRQIYRNGELQEDETMKYIRQGEDVNYDVYSLEMVVAIAFKINSVQSKVFRRYLETKLYGMSNRVFIIRYGSCPTA